MMNPLKKSVAAWALSAAAASALVGVGVFHNPWVSAQEQASQQQVSQAENLATVFRDVGKQVEPSVVEIVVRKTVKAPAGIPLPDDMLRRFFPNGPQGNQGQGDDNNDDGGSPGQFEQVGTGSGVIMEVDGNTAYILTNNHVAGGASEMSVTLNDGRRIDNAKLVGADPKSDLAVVKIEADNLKAAHWGDSSQLQQGDWIVAFGAPFGYVGSMTHGIVSALNRSNVGILGRQGYEDFIQVDAPINPGNSGGPLVNLHGDVVGINTAIASRSGGFNGIGFAIPVNEAKWVYSQLKEHGKVTRGWLGVAIGDVSQQPQVAKALGYDKSTGVLVDDLVQDSPANGKLQRGDVITAINGKPVESVTQLRNVIAEESPGSEVRMTIFREGKDQDVSVKLGLQPENLLASSNQMVPQQHGERNTAEALGMHLASADDQLSQRFNLPDNAQGAVVTSVAPHSPAENAGLMPGDVITQVDRHPVHSAQEAGNLISRHKGNKPILLYVTTGEGGRFVAVQPKK